MRLVILITVAAASIGSCQAPRKLTPAEQEQWTRDSMDYSVLLAKWSRDSTVIDSISRAVNTDSLYRLFHAALPPQPIVPILRAINCESDRLSARYGSMPAEAAIERMNDSLWRGIRKADVDAMNSRLNNMSLDNMRAMGSAQYDCGIKSRLDSLNGTNLTFTPGHPIPPRRPGG